MRGGYGRYVVAVAYRSLSFISFGLDIKSGNSEVKELAHCLVNGCTLQIRKVHLKGK